MQNNHNKEADDDQTRRNSCCATTIPLDDNNKEPGLGVTELDNGTAGALDLSRLFGPPCSRPLE